MIDFHSWSDAREIFSRNAAVLGSAVDRVWRSFSLPTDFHSATLIGDYIYIVGGLRYVDMRRSGETWVYRLHTDEMTIERVATEGDAPGWIFRHEANFDVRTGEIVTHGGKICVEPNAIEPNIGVHAFSPKTGRWRKLGTISDFV